MTSLPLSSYVINPTRTVSDIQQAWTDTLNFVAQQIGGAPETALTIVGGNITPTGGSHSLDTEGSAAADDLTNIATTNLVEGKIILAHITDAARTITLKHAAGGAGQIHLGGSDITLTDPTQTIILQRRGADWYFISPFTPFVSHGHTAGQISGLGALAALDTISGTELDANAATKDKVNQKFTYGTTLPTGGKADDVYFQHEA
ncbi:hypothetical protein [Kiloniella sp.]|uniref:hypothetical protein n=1 Tax=Kiloniella sp. TaxID=1938587 RepID=UPI003B02A8C4